MLSNIAQSGHFPAPMLNLLRGKTVVERVTSRGRVLHTKTGERYLGRHAVCDADNMAFQFRMGAGFAGSVNRFHPATIEPAPINATTPPTPGLACVIDSATGTIRLVQAGDTALVDIYGVLVRPWPYQQGNSPSPNFVGAVAFGVPAPVSQQFGVWDVLRAGYIMVPIVGTPLKGAAVNVWVAAASGAHVQGGFEQNATGGSTIPITGNDKTTFQGAPDAFGIGELAFNI